MPVNVDDTVLFDVFIKYCHFGNRSNSLGAEASQTNNNVTTPLMDGSKWAKLTREASLIDGTVISLTEVDILFNRVKGKGERKISFLQFRMALKLLAEKKHPETEDAEEMVLKMVRNLPGPMITAGTQPDHSPIIDRLMDGPTNYISKSPKDETRAWKDDLRRSSSSPGSRRASSNYHSPLGSRKSSLNPTQNTNASPEKQNTPTKLASSNLATEL